MRKVVHGLAWGKERHRRLCDAARTTFETAHDIDNQVIVAQYATQPHKANVGATQTTRTLCFNYVWDFGVIDAVAQPSDLK